MRKYLFAVALATAAATPALAQDTAPFSGLRVEGLVGYDTTDVEGENSDGVTYGAQVGYDVQSSGAVFGVEGEIADSTVDECVQDLDLAGDELCVSAGRDLYVGGRAGAAVSPNVLVYGKAGYTNARFNYIGGDGTTDYSQNLDTDGLRLGAGVEQKFGAMTFGKIEYRYSNYKEGEVDFEATGVADSDRFDIDTDRHQVVASVGVRF